MNASTKNGAFWNDLPVFRAEGPQHRPGVAAGATANAKERKVHGRFRFCPTLRKFRLKRKIAPIATTVTNRLFQFFSRRFINELIAAGQRQLHFDLTQLHDHGSSHEPVISHGMRPARGWASLDIQPVSFFSVRRYLRLSLGSDVISIAGRVDCIHLFAGTAVTTCPDFNPH